MPVGGGGGGALGGLEKTPVLDGLGTDRPRERCTGPVFFGLGAAPRDFGLGAAPRVGGMATGAPLPAPHLLTASLALWRSMPDASSAAG